MYEHYFYISDQVVVFNNTLLEEKELSLLIYLNIYWGLDNSHCIKVKYPGFVNCSVIIEEIVLD